MEFKEACSLCAVRSAIYRESRPTVRYWKNHTVPLTERVPVEDQAATDWKEHDPNDDYNCSLGAESY
jgi:hypothetical protein